MAAIQRKKTRIEDLCVKVTSGGTPSRTKPEFYTGSIPWIKTGELTGWFINDTGEKITEEAIAKSSTKIYPKNTVLMAMYGDGRTIGSVGITNVEAASNQASCAMIADTEKCYPLYLLYSLQHHREAIVKLALGGAQRNLNQGTIKNYELIMPALHEQKDIADILSTYDYLIENNNRRIAILEEMAQTLYREWFVKFRFPDHENTKFIDSPLGKIPEGWEVVNLNQVAENFDRLRKPLSKMQREKRQGIYPYYGAAKVFDYIDDYIFDGLYLLLAEDGSVITAERKPVLQLVNEKFWPNNHTHILRAKNGVNTEFLNVALSQVDVSPFVTGAAQPKINQTNMNRIQIIKADDSTQAIANEFYKDIFSKYFVLGKKNQNLRKQRDLLLPKLISGAIEIKNTDEVAA